MKKRLGAETLHAMRLLALTDLFALAQVILGYRDITESFHRPLCRFLETSPYPKNLYLLARDHFKTSLLTIAKNIQRVLRNPQIRILIASNKAENAEAMLSEIKGHLQNPWLLRMFPDILYENPTRDAERWTTSAITVKRPKRMKEATIETIGVQGELTSKHYDHATYDDLVGLENSQTREQLLSVIHWWRTSQGLMEPHATQDIVGTPWHYADLYAYLQEQRTKQGMKLGLFKRAAWERVEGQLRPTFPERFSLEKLLERRAEQGSAIFSAQMLLDPVDEDTAVFPRSKLRVVPRREIPDPGSLWCAMTVDPAISTKAWADYSAVAVGGFGPDGTLYLLDLRRGKWSETELMRQIYEAAALTPGIRAVGFEAIAFAKIFKNLFTMEGERRGVYLPVVSLQRDTKITKNVRIRALQPLWELGSLVAAQDCRALEDFLDEADRFRLTKESAHDDLLDAVVDLLQVRGKPVPESTPDSLLVDPEALDRQRFEFRLLEEKPWMDRMNLRVAYHMHRRDQLLEQEREARVLAAGADEFWG